MTKISQRQAIEEIESIDTYFIDIRKIIERKA